MQKGNGYLSMRIFVKASRAGLIRGPWRKAGGGCYALRHVIGVNQTCRDASVFLER